MRLESKTPIEIYTEWTNDFATTKMMAEYYGVSVSDMMAKLYEGRLAYDKKYNNDEITINKIEVATTLAHIYVEAKHEDFYIIYKNEHGGVTKYTDDAQEVFDEAFDMYITILEEAQR
jgi:hypothetical protein